MRFILVGILALALVSCVPTVTSPQVVAPQVPKLEVPARKVLVAILDTGIDSSISGVVGRVNFTNSSLVTSGHGTQMAKIISSGNVDLLDVKVVDSKGRVWPSVVAKGIVWAIDRGADVINLSLYVYGPWLDLEEAVEYAVARGVVLVAAAGNYVRSGPTYPAYYPGVVSVGATDGNGNILESSNWGDWIDIYAVGASTSEATASVSRDIARRLVMGGIK